VTALPPGHSLPQQATSINTFLSKDTAFIPLVHRPQDNAMEPLSGRQSCNRLAKDRFMRQSVFLPISLDGLPVIWMTNDD
jgi:hypothetical protein